MNAASRKSPFDALMQDLRYAVRLLKRSPGFTVLAVLILALGIGANSSIFSVVSAVLLRPLPFAEPDRLVFLWEDASAVHGPSRVEAALANAVDWKARSRSFEDMAVFDGLTTYNLTGDGEPERLAGARTTTNLFAVLGLQPIVGRTFSADDEGPDATPVAVVSETLWARRFGADPRLVGRTIVLDGVKHTVIGVVPPDFRFPNKDTDVWVPAAFTPRERAQRNNHQLYVVARLKPGITLAEAQADMTSVAKSMARDYPRTNANLGITVSPLRAELARGASVLGGGDVRRGLFVLLGAVAIILAITCANVANLLLARGTARRKELALRQALGAGERRVLRQLLTESALLAGLGLVVGIALSRLSFGYLARLIPATLPNGSAHGLDWRVLCFTAGITALTVFLFGAGPALAAARVDFGQAVNKSIGRGVGPRGARAGNALIVGEIMLTVVLLAGAGLLLRSYADLLDVDAGFRPDHLLLAETTLSPSKYDGLASRKAFYARVLERVRALPGVSSAGYVNEPPLMFKGGQVAVEIEGQPPPQRPEDIIRQLASDRMVSAGYLETLGVPLIRGRRLDGRDAPGAPPAVVINEAMAKAHWPGTNPVGRRFRFGGPDTPWFTVVGVVGNVRQMGLDVAPNPEFYSPVSQLGADVPFLWPKYLVVRTEAEPRALAAAVRKAIRDVDPDQPVEFRTMSDVFDAELANRTTQLTLVGGFAALALLLAAVGLYGVLSYAVARRSAEIGLRMALGAPRVQIIGSVVGSALLMALVGVALGLAAAFALSRLLASFLFEVSPTDPATFAGVSAALVLVALFASYVPARRAAEVEPASALRME